MHSNSNFGYCKINSFIVPALLDSTAFLKATITRACAVVDY